MCDCGCCDFGGVCGDAYSTPLNTLGVGDVIAPTCNSYGSGDRFDMFYFPMAVKSKGYGKINKKKKSKRQKA